MAIQISEDKLSSEAKEALRNAKSKSQLLRDALEAYVRNMNVSSTIPNNNLISDIKDIKEMLLKISEGTIQVTKENIKQDKVSKINKNIELEGLSKEKKINDIENVSKVVNISEAENKIIDEIKELVPKKVIEQSKDDNNEMSEEEKRRIEEMVNNSLNMI